MFSFLVNGVPCSLYVGEDGQQGGLRVTYPPDGPHATMVLQCPWAGLSAVYNGLRGGVINGVRVPPTQFPYGENLFCTAVSDPVSIGYTRWNDGFPGYKLARFTAEFTVPPFDFLDHDPTTPHMDPSGWAYTTTTLRTSAEMFSPPYGSYYWEQLTDVGKPVAGATVGKLLTKTEYSVKVHWMSTGDIPGIADLEGTLNLNPVQIGATTYPKGTLLFASGNSEIAPESFGGRIWNYEYIFIGNGPVDDPFWGVMIPEWNMYMNSYGTYSLINTKADGSGKRVYPYADAWGTLPR